MLKKQAATNKFHKFLKENLIIKQGFLLNKKVSYYLKLKKLNLKCYVSSRTCFQENDCLF